LVRENRSPHQNYLSVGSWWTSAGHPGFITRPGIGHRGSLPRGQILGRPVHETGPAAGDGCEPAARGNPGGYDHPESGNPARIIDASPAVHTLSNPYGSPAVGAAGVWVCNLLSGIKMMRLNRLMRVATALASGSVMLQLGGCTSADAFDFIQTILLGITAAGSWVIIQNV
jgi:hypothetical protein